MIWLAALSLLIWAYLLTLHGGFWRSGPVLPPAMPASAPPASAPPASAPPASAPPVCVVIPARDEACVIAATVASLLAQDYPGELRVIVVDDASADGTGDLARALADPRLLVIDAAPRPAGWSGKLWAVAQGVEAARGKYVLLTDADIVHAPGHLSALVAHAEAAELDLVSEMVRLACDSPAERALTPAFVFFFQLLYPFARVNDAGSRVAAGAGGTMLVRRAALERIGGIACVRGALIDDVALAAALKRHGRIWLGHSALARSVRHYPGLADIWRMIARTAYTQLRFSPALLAATMLGMALTWLAPPALALFGHGAARACGALAWTAMAASYLPTLRRYGRAPIWAVALPLVACFYMAATVGSAVDHWRGRGVIWKGRSYA